MNYEILVIWPWPWSNDLGTQTWPRYYKDVCVLKIKFLPSAVQKLSSETDTDGQMDRETDTYTHTDKQTDRQTWLNLLPTKYTNGNYYVNWSIVLNFDLVLIKDTVNLKEVFWINRGRPVCQGQGYIKVKVKYLLPFQLYLKFYLF